jgi:gas vesicle protein
MDDDSKLSYFFLGLGLGVAAGILFAPKSGIETREFLLSKASDGADYAKEQANELNEYAKKQAAELNEFARKQAADLKRQAADLKETAAEQVERGKSTIVRHKENIVAAVDAGKQAYREAVRTPIVD